MVKLGLHGHNVGCGARSPVDAFCVQAMEINGANTLIDNSWHSAAISGKEFVERDAEDRAKRWQVGSVRVIAPLATGQHCCSTGRAGHSRRGIAVSTLRS